MVTKYIGILSVCVIALGVCGCASVVRGGSQTLTISTPPATGAECTLHNNRGEWHVVTPGEVKISRSKTPLFIDCTKVGWQPGRIEVHSYVEGWTFGNIAIGGLIGVGIDAATGAITRYNNSYIIPLKPLAQNTNAVLPAGVGTVPAAETKSETGN